MGSPDLLIGQRGPVAPASPNPASRRITCAPVTEQAWGVGGSKLFIDTHSSLFRLQGLRDWDPSVAGIWDSQNKRRHFGLELLLGVELLLRMYETLSVVPSSPQTREGWLSLPKLR